MGFMQRKKRPHIYRDPNVPWPHETYLEGKAARAAAAGEARNESVVASPSKKKSKKKSKTKRK